jgi:hypothetical protein
LILSAFGHEKPEGRLSNYGNENKKKSVNQAYYMSWLMKVAYTSSLAGANLIWKTGNEAWVAHEDSCLDLRDCR